MDALRTVAGRLVAIAVLGLVAGLLPVLSPAPALADAGLEQQFVTAINAERTAAGLSGLSPAGDLTTASRRHAQTMGTADHLHHNPNLGSAVGGWQKLGENVGRGPDVGAIHRAFMASPGHRRNVLDPAFTQVGIGVVVHQGQIWVTEMFRLPTGGATPEPAESEPSAPAQVAPEPTAEADPAPATPTPSGPRAATDDGEPPAAAPASSGPAQADRMLLVQMRVADHDA